MYVDLQYLFIHTIFKCNKKYRNFTLKYFIACQEEFYSDLLLHGDRHFQEVVWFDTWLFLFVKWVNNASLIKCSVQFSHSVVSDSLQPHESQHARPPWPSPTPRVHSDSYPSSQWCHPAISSVISFSCPQSLPASESFPMSQLVAWGGQSTGVSALASTIHVNDSR